MVAGLDLNQILTLKVRPHYHIHVRTVLPELIILMIFIDNVPTLYQDKYSEKNRINYLPAQFRYRISSNKRQASN